MVLIAFRLAQVEKEALERYCKDRDLNVSQLLRKLVKDHLKTLETPDAATTTS